MKAGVILGWLLMLPAVATAQDQTVVHNQQENQVHNSGTTAYTHGTQKGGVEEALKEINPQDKDYGALVHESKVALVEETIDNWYWKACMGIAIVEACTLMSVLWLLRERAVRLNCSADIVAQLFNSSLTARQKAIEAINEYNALAKKYNSRFVEQVVVRVTEESKELRASRKAGLEEEEKISDDIPKLGTETLVPTKRSYQPRSHPLRRRRLTSYG